MKVFDNADANLVAQLLASKAIVAIFQGRAESGARALGNRSILWAPYLESAKFRVNKLKKRELWRPFAGVILESDANYWFDMKGIGTSPYMSYAVKLKDDTDEGRGKLISIIHNDGTCRIQTVNQEQNLELYKIIKEFNSSCPEFPAMIGNTSFNRAGEPLIHTLDQALEALESDFIEYLYLPEQGKLLYSPNV